MKPITESPEIFEAYARIECRLFEMKKYIDSLANMELSPAQIHKDTQSVKMLINDQIEDKKIIEADYQNDLLLLHNLDTL